MKAQSLNYVMFDGVNNHQQALTLSYGVIHASPSGLSIIADGTFLLSSGTLPWSQISGAPGFITSSGTAAIAVRTYSSFNTLFGFNGFVNGNYAGDLGSLLRQVGAVYSFGGFYGDGTHLTGTGSSFTAQAALTDKWGDDLTALFSGLGGYVGASNFANITNAKFTDFFIARGYTINGFNGDFLQSNGSGAGLTGTTGMTVPAAQVSGTFTHNSIDPTTGGKAVATSPYTVLASDNGTVLVMTGSTTLIAPALTAGFNVGVLQAGTQQTTVSGATGITVFNQTGDTKTAGQWATATLIYTTSTTAVWCGNTSN